MEQRLLRSSSSLLFHPFLFFLLFLFHYFHLSQAQQTYINNKQLDCYNYKNDSSTNGYLCNGLQKSCVSYLTFRSLSPYDTPISIGYLLGAKATEIAQLNNIAEVDSIPTNTLIMVPVNCSCSGNFYQHNTSYTLKDSSETYFTVANNTYQSLSTCQALINQNPYDSHNLTVGLQLLVPLRCACPTRNQTAHGFKFLLTYLMTWGDDVSSVGETFGVDAQSINEANDLESGETIYALTPILVPLKSQPTIIKKSISPAPSQSLEPSPAISNDGHNSSNKKWVFIGIGIAAGLVLLAFSGFLIWFLHRRTRRTKPSPERKNLDESADYSIIPENKSGNVSSQVPRYTIDSLTLYSFEDLQRATGFFSENHKIKGSVYRGKINGDDAAIKRMKGDVSNEINILKQVNHSNIIRLSGFCEHQGSTYLVYEFAEKGSLNDWLHEEYQSSCPLEWTQRVKIAYHVADGLNYLHNYTNPAYIHKNLKSSNILLDGNFRAKIANFGVARTMEDEEGLQMTRHVVGTQGYMAPEYIENGVVTPKLDVFAFGVVMLELLSGREAATASDDEKKTECMLSGTILKVLEGENVREKLRGFIDPSLRNEYPLDLAFSMAQLAKNCVAYDLNSRPAIPEVFLSLSQILSSSLDWDPSDNNLQNSRSFGHGR